MSRAATRGLSLIETLIALGVLSLALGAMVRTQQLLWQGTDAAADRSDALRLVQAQLEQARSVNRLDSQPGSTAWADIAAQADADIADRSPTTVFRVGSDLSTQTTPPLKTMRPRARWTDRHGVAHELALVSAMAGLDPRLAGWLLLAPDGRTHAAPQGRHPAIPIEARDLGDGRSAFKPRADQSLAWVFDNRTAVVTHRCSTAVGLDNAALTAGSLSACTALTGYLVSGTVRFAGAGLSLTSADAEQPAGTALPLHLRVTLTSTGHTDPGWECVDNAPTSVDSGQAAVRYWCVIQAVGTPPRWSGRLDIDPQGWTVTAPQAGTWRVCRYSADHDGNGAIDPTEHPASYAQVTGALVQQNFLIAASLANCPTDGPANLAAVPPNYADDSTVAHQP